MRKTLLLFLFLAAGLLFAEDRAARKKKEALKDTSTAKEWVYDDLPAAFEAASRQGKPLLIVFR